MTSEIDSLLDPSLINRVIMSFGKLRVYIITLFRIGQRELSL